MITEKEYKDAQKIVDNYKTQQLNIGDVSGYVWIVQDTMSGMIAGMFNSQIKAIKYTNKSKGMAIIKMEVIQFYIMEILGIIIALLGLGFYLSGLDKADEHGEEIIKQNKIKREEERKKWMKDNFI